MAGQTNGMRVSKVSGLSCITCDRWSLIAGLMIPQSQHVWWKTCSRSFSHRFGRWSNTCMHSKWSAWKTEQKGGTFPTHVNNELLIWKIHPWPCRTLYLTWSTEASTKSCKKMWSQTYKRLKEHLLIGWNRTKHTHFQGSPLFQAMYNIKTEKQFIQLILCQSDVGGWWKEKALSACPLLFLHTCCWYLQRNGWIIELLNKK